MNKKIKILTYDAPHRKTQDLLQGLITSGYQNVEVLAIPWVQRKNFVPLYPHHPPTQWDVPPRELCQNLGYNFTKIENYDEIESSPDQIFIIGGAGILPQDFVENNLVINSHPGYLPLSRGLDSFKWSVYYDKPIGVTTYFASKECDAGILIEKKLVPLHSWDTLHSVAYRQHEMEIKMLIESIDKVEEALEKQEVIPPDQTEVYRRMPHRKEMRLMDRFKTIIDRIDLYTW